MAEIEVGPVGDLKPGDVIGAGPWAVGNSGGELFAVSRKCRHLRADLAGGKIGEDGCLECPWHHARFDVRTGRMTVGPRGGFAKVPGLDWFFRTLTKLRPLRRGTVVERNGTLFVD